MADDMIIAVHARSVWDSRGRPTVEAEVTLAGGAIGRAIAPAGASRGRREATDRRDGGPRLQGLGVERAVEAVRREIAPALIGRDGADQAGCDAVLVALDGTPNLARLGGNAVVAVSMALVKAAANARGLPLWRHLAGEADPLLPLAEVQIFGGGAHAGRRLDLQDFMVMVPFAPSFRESMEGVAEIYHAAGAVMAERGLLRGVADEGGFWPEFADDEQALETLVRAIERAGLRPGVDAFISLDIAASEFGSAGTYRLRSAAAPLDRSAWLARIEDWIGRYPIVSIEDAFAEDDPQGHADLTARQGARLQLVGDDLLVTNPAIIADAQRRRLCNASLIKVNQIGTISQAHEALKTARAGGWGTLVSARSGESEDVTIAHLAVGWAAGQFKVGSMTRSERLAKWNEVLRIEEAAGGRARFAGPDIMATFGITPPG